MYSVLFFCSAIFGFHLLIVSSTEPELLTNQNCSNESDCTDSSSYCNSLKQCECKLGYTLQQDTVKNSSHCMIYNCTEVNHDCSKFWGPDVRCVKKNQVTSQCECSSRQFYLPFHRICRKSFTSKIGEKCDDTSDCSATTTCSRGKCQCRVGDLPVNDYECVPYRCKTDEECVPLFNNTRCANYMNLCVCANSYKLTSGDTSCILADKHSVCSFASNCGKNVACRQHKCVCQQGYTWKNDWDCEQIKCTVNQQCIDQDKYSYCDTETHQCKCLHSTSIDGSLCNMPPLDLKPDPNEQQKTAKVLLIIFYVVAGSIAVVLAILIASRFYYQITH